MASIRGLFLDRVRNSLIKNYLSLIVLSHNDSIYDVNPLVKLNEDVRRNQLHKFMQLNKKKCKVNGIIVTESSNYDQNYITISREDITFYPSQFSDKGVVFECKITKKHLYPSEFKKIFYDEGLDRYQVKYPTDLDFCGIIIFCENSSHVDINKHTLNNISGKYVDVSKVYTKNYIYKYDYMSISDLYVILLEN